MAHQRPQRFATGRICNSRCMLQRVSLGEHAGARIAPGAYRRSLCRSSSVLQRPSPILAGQAAKMRDRSSGAARALAGVASALFLAAASLDALAVEGALGRPVSGTSVTPDAGVIPPEPVWIVNIGQIYLDGSISGSREVPISGKSPWGSTPRPHSRLRRCSRYGTPVPVRGTSRRA